MLAIRRILHPTDFSDASRPAFELACALARDSKAELVILHVSPPPIVGGGEGMLVEPPRWAIDEARTRLEQVRPSDPRIAASHRLDEGDEGRTIVKVADEMRADLIVMGTHGRSGLGRLLVGSVAEAVMRKAPCPVLTLKPPHPHV